MVDDEVKQRQWRAYAASVELGNVSLESIIDTVWELVGPSCARILAKAAEAWFPPAMGSGVPEASMHGWQIDGLGLTVFCRAKTHVISGSDLPERENVVSNSSKLLNLAGR
jgi:hypothetical protein